MRISLIFLSSPTAAVPNPLAFRGHSSSLLAISTERHFEMSQVSEFSDKNKYFLKKRFSSKKQLIANYKQRKLGFFGKLWSLYPKIQQPEGFLPTSLVNF